MGTTKNVAVDYASIVKGADMVPVKASELYKNDKAIVKALGVINVNGTAFYRLVHIAACSVLRRVGETGDVRIVNALFTVLPEGTRANSLRDWLSAYGPIAFEQNKPVHVKGKAVELTKAILDPFWKFSPEPVYQPVDVAKMIAAAVKKLHADEEKVGADHTAVIAALEAIKVPVPATV